MIQSMTGYGRAQLQDEAGSVTVEVRSVNNRFLKVSVRAPEIWDPLSREVESLVKERVVRGSVLVNVRKSGVVANGRELVINRDVIREYRRQLEEIEGGKDVKLSLLLSLPGTVGAAEETPEELEQVWEKLSVVVRQALDQMLEMRGREGEHLRGALLVVVERLKELTGDVQRAAPAMVASYRDRLVQRVNELLSGTDVAVSQTDLARELAIFAERSDIREEIDRMGSHLKQFTDLLDAEGSVGRQLEFLVQEMFREANTMGSKAADAELARVVLDIKAEIDRLKEQVMNVE